MKQLAILVGFMIFSLFAWLLGSSLSSDALGMAVGMIFGLLAGVPTLLLVLAANRRRGVYGDDYEDDRQPPAQLLAERTTVTVTERVYGALPERRPSCYVTALPAHATLRNDADDWE